MQFQRFGPLPLWRGDGDTQASTGAVTESRILICKENERETLSLMEAFKTPKPASSDTLLPRGLHLLNLLRSQIAWLFGD